MGGPRGAVRSRGSGKGVGGVSASYAITVAQRFSFLFRFLCKRKKKGAARERSDGWATRCLCNGGAAKVWVGLSRQLCNYGRHIWLGAGHGSSRGVGVD